MKIGFIRNARNPSIPDDNIEFIKTPPFIINLFVITAIGAL